MTRQLLLVSAILTCFVKAIAGIHDIRFSHIGIDEGLSHATVNGISQDAYGYIWIATPDGLNRFDGHRFTVFRPDSLDHDVRGVATGSDGTLWAFTAGELSRYSPAAAAFESFPAPQGTAFTAVVPAGKGRLAAGTSGGLFFFDTATGQFAPVPAAKGMNVTAVTHTGDDGDVLFGTFGGDVFRIGRNGDAARIARPGNTEINTFLRDRNTLLIGTEGDGLWVLADGATAPVRIGEAEGIEHVRSLLPDNQGRIWIGTFTGLYILDSDRRKFSFYSEDSGSDGALSHSSVRRMFSDNQGGIWLGTYFGGLNYYNPALNQFTTLTPHGRDGRSMAGNIAGPIAEDHSGNVWIGTNNAGLNIYSPRTGSVRNISRKDGLGSDDIKAIYIDEKAGKAYVGTHIGGISTIDLATQRIVTDRHTAKSVYDIIPAAGGSGLWLATLEGVSLLSTADRTARRVRAEGMPELTTSLMRDSHGHLWVAGEDGLAVFNESDGTLSPVPGLPRLPYHINDVCQARSDGRIWIASHRGLFCYDEHTGHTSAFGLADGMPGDIVYAILEDPSGRIWASTNRGLVRIDPATRAVMTYANREGLDNRQFTDRSALRAGNGLMYFGGTGGVTFFNPTMLEKNLNAPAPVIEGVSLFNKPVTPADSTGILDRGFPDADRLVFRHDQTNFTIDFTTCDYISKGDNSFSYMLDGLDRQWNTAPPGVRSVTYSSLPAGRYTFRLRAANNDGVWSDTEATVSIVILPPWYRTWWALVLFVLAGLAAATLAIRYVWRRKSRERAQKAREEVNEMKVRFFVNLSHELRTPLTLMLLPLTEMIDSRPDPATMRKLSTIRNNTLRIRHIVNQMLDYRRAELGMFRLNVAVCDIDRLLSGILESYRPLAAGKKINFSYDCTMDRTEVMADTNYIELIVNNLVTNAFKYTPDGGEIAVSISDSGGSAMRIDVRDSGCGIPADKLDAIFTRFYQVNDSAGGYGIGLSLVKKLVELHHGTISVQSTVGKGSIFSVVLPVGADSFAPEEIAADPAAPRIHTEEVAALLPVDGENAGGDPEDADPAETGGADEHKTLLIVDDNAEILKYLSAALSPAFRVFTAANGTKAIELLGTESIDLVVSDVMMPDMDGVQLCRAIKRNLRTSHIPVILLSAKADIADRLEGLKVGADEYIPKPFSLEELLAKVRNIVRTRENIIRHYSRDSLVEIEPAKVAQNPLDEEFLKKAIRIMGEHLDDSQFTTDEFARLMCMSRSNLHLKMKALTGESTNDFIRRARLRKAAEILKTRRYSVAEVSAMVGYNSPAYFATAFKNFFGCSPSSLLSQNN